MQKNYELLYIVHPDLEGSIEKITEKVTSFVTKAGGKATSHEVLGKRKLAYQIAKNDFGIYSLVYFDIESTKLSDVERDLRLTEEIMRSMIVVVPVVSPVTLAKRKPRIKKEDMVAKKDEPANIIEKEETPKTKKTTKKIEKVAPEKTVEAEEVTESAKAVKVAKVVAKKKATPTRQTGLESAKKTAKPKTAAKDDTAASAKAEKERLKKLDDKLDELLK